MSRMTLSYLILVTSYALAAVAWYGLQWAADVRFGREVSWGRNALVTLVEWLVVVGVTLYQWRQGE